MYPVPVIVPFNNVVFFRGGRSGIAREVRLRNGSNFACASARPMRSVWRRAAMPLGARSRDPLDKRDLVSGLVRKCVVLGSCACCAGVLPFWVIFVVCVWRWLCGLVLCIQTTGRLNTKHPAANVFTNPVPHVITYSRALQDALRPHAVRQDHRPGDAFQHLPARCRPTRPLGGGDDAFDTFFSETGAGKHVPRAASAVCCSVGEPHASQRTGACMPSICKVLLYVYYDLYDAEFTQVACQPRRR